MKKVVKNKVNEINNIMLSRYRVDNLGILIFEWKRWRRIRDR